MKTGWPKRAPARNWTNLTRRRPFRLMRFNGRSWLAFANSIANRSLLRSGRGSAGALDYASRKNKKLNRIERWLIPEKLISLQLGIYNNPSFLFSPYNNLPGTVNQNVYQINYPIRILISTEKTCEKITNNQQRVEFNQTTWYQKSNHEQIEHPQLQQNDVRLQIAPIVYGPNEGSREKDPGKEQGLTSDSRFRPYQTSAGKPSAIGEKPRTSANVDLDQLANEVLTRLDRRLVAYQERMGRE